ncbi:TPMT family class I SAM-dependent methyltransferase [Lutimonas saemankumensis]|uniref:TPMT family class I SAM-dependent methyltransferase n=1 Tax=Lutimonas saemankumensis TaxID=483016 RepID=UPI001CD5EEB4|nr:TPMT family class I SAM-dependent methyltransferase [Lutimonas saemankumensis]MCA0931832.1 TPMT family class I SAM-dependent methyltransferase [Lutimonas saemankumensis]
MTFDASFWSEKYNTNQTGWDMGQVSPPLKKYIDQLENKDLSILIPGAGNAYEAAYLFKKGFSDVTVLDLVKEPLENFKKRVPEFPKSHLIQEDFFQHQGQYDLILEQTFFCALDPSLRMDYINKMNSLLKDNGKLVGLLFDFRLTDEGPPFGGDADAYSLAFEKRFHLRTMSPCYNSIKPRLGNELFIIFEKIK